MWHYEALTTQIEIHSIQVRTSLHIFSLTDSCLNTCRQRFASSGHRRQTGKALRAG